MKTLASMLAVRSVFCLAVLAQATAAQDTARPSTTFALIGGRVIVGDGSPAHDDWTIVVTGGRITAVGPRNKLMVPAGVTAIDVRGKSVIPGLIDAHGHHYANTGRIRNMFEAYAPLYLAGGVTSVISPGDFDAEGMYDLKMRINRGETAGARIFMGGYYIDNKPSEIGWFKPISNATEAAQRVEEWKDRIDIVKFYTSITDDEMRAALAVARKYGLPATAHLGTKPGSVNASRAIDLGVNGLEHGLPMAMRAFYDADSTLDEKGPCPMGDLDLDRPVVRALIEKIVRNKIAIDPTFITWRVGDDGFEPVTANRDRFFSEAYQSRIAARKEQVRARAAASPQPPVDSVKLASQRACAARTEEKGEEYVRRIWEKGGTILAGTDPVDPELIPGYGLHREMQILVHAGIPPLETIKAASYNAAVAIRRDKDLGSITVGKLADLVVVDGDPSVRIEDVGKTVMVFQAGVRYDPAVLRKMAEGKIDVLAPVSPSSGAASRLPPAAQRRPEPRR